MHSSVRSRYAVTLTRSRQGTVSSCTDGMVNAYARGVVEVRLAVRSRYGSWCGRGTARGAVEVRSWCGRGTLVVRSRYARGAVEVRSRTRGTVLVRSRYARGALPVRCGLLTFQRAILYVRMYALSNLLAHTQTVGIRTQRAVNLPPAIPQLLLPLQCGVRSRRREGHQTLENAWIIRWINLPSLPSLPLSLPLLPSLLSLPPSLRPSPFFLPFSPCLPLPPSLPLPHSHTHHSHSVPRVRTSCPCSVPISCQREARLREM